MAAMSGSAVVALFASIIYAVSKGFNLKQSLLAGGIGAFFAACLWLFLGSYLNLALFFFVPVGFGCGFAGYPLVRAYTKRDDALADGAIDAAKKRVGL